VFGIMVDFLQKKNAAGTILFSSMPAPPPHSAMSAGQKDLHINVTRNADFSGAPSIPPAVGHGARPEQGEQSKGFLLRRKIRTPDFLRNPRNIAEPANSVAVFRLQWPTSLHAMSRRSSPAFATQALILWKRSRAGSTGRASVHHAANAGTLHRSLTYSRVRRAAPADPQEPF
jgi:hypothetical protein